MKREELAELHYISPVENVRSIMEHGIVSHRLANDLPHKSVAMEEIQARRGAVQVTGGRPLHEYVNLYVCARNPMLYKRKEDHQRLCVLRVDTMVIELPKVVISDRNASADLARFSPAPEGLVRLDRDRVFAEYWTHPDDPTEERSHKSMKCAEVLVPDRVDPRFIVGAYVSCRGTEIALKQIVPSLPVTVDSHLFFQGRRG